MAAAMTMPLSARMDPTDKSMPAVAITNVMPVPTISRTAD